MRIKKIKKAVIYVRVSDIKQVIDGVSLDHQEAKCRAFMEMEDYEVVKVFREEGQSGKDEWRDEFQAMMKFIRDNREEIDAVCFYALSRLGRKVILVLNTIEQLKRMSVEVYSYSEKLDTTTPAGQFTLTILSALAQLESDQIRDRVMPAMHFSVENRGVWMGARYVPFGYKSEKVIDENNKERKKLVVVPQEAEIVKLIFKYYVEGIENNHNVGQFIIAKYLNQQGFRYRDGSEWTSKRVSDILRNGHLYAGYLMWNRYGTEFKIIETENAYGTNVQYEMSKRTKTPKPVRVRYKKNDDEIAFGKGTHEAIISEEYWKISKEKLEQNRQKINTETLNLTRQSRNLLTHVLVCPTCGGAMGASKQKRVSRGVTIEEINYKCQKASRGETCDYNVVKEDYFMDTVKNVVFAYYQYYILNRVHLMIMEQLKFNQRVNKVVDNRLITLEEEKEKLSKKKLDYINLYSEGILNANELKKYTSPIDAEMNEIEKKILLIQRENINKVVQLNEIGHIVNKLKAFKDIEEYYNSLPVEGKIQLINEVIHKIEFNKDKTKKGSKSVQIRKIILNSKMFYDVVDKQEYAEFLDFVRSDDENIVKYERAMNEIGNIFGMNLDNTYKNKNLMRKLMELGRDYNILFYNNDTGEYLTPNTEAYFYTYLFDDEDEMLDDIGGIENFAKLVAKNYKDKMKKQGN